MKFVKVTPLLSPVDLPEIYTDYRNTYNALRIRDDVKGEIDDLEERFAKDIMSQTLDNLQIQLESHESLWIVMNGDWAINITKRVGGTIFNLNGFIKLIGGLPKFTYFVVMNDRRTDSVTLRMFPTRLGMMVIHKSKEYSPTVELEFKL